MDSIGGRSMGEMPIRYISRDKSANIQKATSIRGRLAWIRFNCVRDCRGVFLSGRPGVKSY